MSRSRPAFDAGAYLYIEPGRNFSSPEDRRFKSCPRNQITQALKATSGGQECTSGIFDHDNFESPPLLYGCRPF